MDLDDQSLVAQRAGRQHGVETLRTSKVDFRSFGHVEPFEIMYRQVFVALAFGVPNDRDFHFARLIRFQPLDVVHARERITRLVGAAVAVEVQAEYRIGKVNLFHAASLTGCPGYTCNVKLRSKSLRRTASPATTSFQWIWLWSERNECMAPAGISSGRCASNGLSGCISNCSRRNTSRSKTRSVAVRVLVPCR